MKTRRSILSIDESRCDGCALCTPWCLDGAIRIVDRKAKLFAERFCDGCGLCLEKCPTGALALVERDVEEYEEVLGGRGC